MVELEEVDDGPGITFLGDENSLSSSVKFLLVQNEVFSKEVWELVFAVLIEVLKVGHVDDDIGGLERVLGGRKVPDHLLEDFERKVLIFFFFQKFVQLHNFQLTFDGQKASLLHEMADNRCQANGLIALNGEKQLNVFESGHRLMQEALEVVAESILPKVLHQSLLLGELVLPEVLQLGILGEDLGEVGFEEVCPGCVLFNFARNHLINIKRRSNKWALGKEVGKGNPAEGGERPRKERKFDFGSNGLQI